MTDKVCPVKMACLGCVAKMQPEKKHELLETIELSKDMEKRFVSMGLTIEVNKAKQMQKLARNELKEIELMKNTRRNRHMSHTFPSRNNRIWLKGVYESRSQRSLLLGKGQLTFWSNKTFLLH